MNVVKIWSFDLIFDYLCFQINLKFQNLHKKIEKKHFGNFLVLLCYRELCEFKKVFPFFFSLLMRYKTMFKNEKIIHFEFFRDNEVKIQNFAFSNDTSDVINESIFLLPHPQKIPTIYFFLFQT